MYAVVKTGGKQYKVSQDDTVLVEKINAKEGETVKLSDVLLFDDGKELKVGKPFVDNAFVDAKIIRQTKSKKIIIFKRKRRKNHRKLQGHRQNLTLIKIVSFNGKINKSSTPIVSKESKLKKEKQIVNKKKTSK